MSELDQILMGDSYAAPAANILEGLNNELAHHKPAGAPHSIYEELWHIVFWQQVSLDWVAGIKTPFPASPRDGFPTVLDADCEYWEALRERFFRGAEQAAETTRDAACLDQSIQCPSRPGDPMREMTVRDQLESLGAHNAYHFGRIVLLRQLLGAWPPPSGGYSW
jgi:uncharacterized damage-inducible protein DinB